MTLRKRTTWTHEHLMRTIIMMVKVTVVLAIIMGTYLWITRRDWLLLALGAWGALALHMIISTDKRHSQDDS